MPTTPSSTESPAELRNRLAELGERYQQLIVHGDVVSRADCREEIEAIQRKLRGAPAAPAKDEAFFGRAKAGPEMPGKSARKAPPAPAAGSLADEFRRTIAEARSKGLIRGIDPGAPLAKDGALLAGIEGVRVVIMLVTAEIAERWMLNNYPGNRTVSDDVVASYARDAKEGHWVTTHQGVAFNDQDELIDGQHRLLGIIRSGVACVLMVSFGWPVAVPGTEAKRMDFIDRGRPRSVADQLKIQHGMKDGSAIAAICATLGGVCYGERTRRLSVPQTLEIYRAFEGPVKWVIAHRSKERGLKSTGVMAGFAFALAGCVMQAETAKIEAMWTALMNGRLGDGTAIGQLRALLTSDAAVLLTRGTDRAMIEVVLEAIRLELSASTDLLTQTTAGADFYRARQPDRVSRIAAIFRLPAA